jgi:hypothetical protein
MKRQQLQRKGGINMQKWYFRSILASLAVVLVMVVSLNILGCGGGDDVPPLPTLTVATTTANSNMLVGTTWSFLNGGIFHPDFSQARCTLTFTATATTPNFTLTCPTATVTGTTAFASCDLNYEESTSATVGPQGGDSSTFDPCTVDIPGSTCDPEDFDSNVSCPATLSLTSGSLRQDSESVDVDVKVSEDGSVFVNDVDTGENISLTGTGGSGG